MKQAEVQRELYDGFGEALTRALEFVVIPLVFGFVGHLIDGRFGVAPLFMLLFGLVGLVGCAIKTFYSYRHRMAEAEKDMPWNR